MRVYASAEMTLTDTNDGISVTGIDRYYMASSSSSGITVGSQGWKPDPQETNPISRYHWSYELVNYSSGPPVPTKPAVIGVYGKEGKDGVDAVTVALSSEAHTFAGTESQAIASSLSIDINAFKGNQRIATSIGTVTGGITGQLTHSEVGRGTTSNKLVINVTNLLNKANGTLSIPIVADGRTFNKVFSWSVAFKGIPGEKGTDGTTTYTWIRYADTPTSGMSNSPIDKKYIGLSFNQTTQTESSNYNDYQWSLMPQNIEIGGRNLLRNSGEEVSNGLYNIARYDLTDEIKEGEEVTLTIWGSLATTKSSFTAYNSGGAVAVTTLTDNGDGAYSSTFKWRIGSSTNTYLNVYAFTNAQTGISTINKIKLEKGNVTTDWTPAPEDIQSQVDKTVKSTDVEYYLSTSSTGLAGGSWQTTAPAWVNGRFMWSRTKVVLNDGTPIYNPSTTGTNITGASGATGSIGATGRGVSSIVEQFYLSDSKTTQTGGSWVTKMPTWSVGKYVWTRSLITYTTGTPATSTTEPLVSSEWEAVNDLQIGVRNLLRNSNFTDGFAYWTGSGTRELISDAVFGSVAKFTTTSNTGLVQKPVKELIVGKEYTLSTYVKTENTSQTVYLAIDGNGVGAAKSHSVSNEWTKISSVFTFSGVNLNARIYSLGVLYVANVKLEEGNKATDWTEAPEDTQSQIDDTKEQVKKTVKTITEEYYQSTSSTSQTGGNWTTVAPTWQEGKFIFIRSKITYVDDTTDYTPIINITGAKGDTGKQGPPGIQGPSGSNGQSQWVHIRYSANSNGASMTTNPYSTTKYVGIAVTNSATAPAYTGFAWSKYVGENGAPGDPGIPGDKGADGKTTYTWVRYADTPTSGMNQYPDGKKYIGLAFNKITQTESNNYSDYQWSLMPQNIDIGGRNLILDSNNILMDGSDSGNRGLAIKEQDYISITPKITGNVYANGAVKTSLDRVQNETYTVSLEVNTLESTGMYWYVSGSQTFSNIIPNTNGKWVRVSHTYTQSGETADGNIGFLWGFNRLTAGKEIKYRNLKLEKGNVATDWTPAPEDIYKYSEDVAQAKAEAERIKAEAYADGIVTAEERERIAQAEQVLKDAKAHALESIADIKVGGRNYFRKSDFENPTLSGVSGYGYSNEDYINGFKVTGANNGRAGYVQFDNVIPENGTYTFSFKMRGTQSATSNSVIVNICGVVSEQIYSSADNNYNHFSFTAKVDNWSAENNWVKIEYINWQYYRFDDVKLEKGNTASDWTPAPEDVTASIKAAQDKANAASQEAIAAQADATVGKNMADNLSNDSIITQVEKLELKREWDAIVKEKPSITIQATDYALQGSTEATAYNTAYTVLNGSIPSLLANMKVTSGVTRTTFNNNFANYYDKRQLLLNRIAKKAKELADAAQSSVDNLDIGGRNYFSLTHLNSLSPSSWVVGAYVYNFTLEPNTKYILSSNVPTNGNASETVLYFNGSGTASSGVWLNSPKIMETDNEGKFYIAIPTGRTYTDKIRNGDYWVQLEKGNTATDWTPAPEDIEAAFTAVAQAKAEAERAKAESYADGKVTAEEAARIADADAKLAAAKKYAEDQILADKTIQDTRNNNQTPAWYYTNHPRRTIKEFKLTSVIGVVSSEGTYGILETEIPWNDASGGPVKQTFRVNSKTFKRSGTTTSWSSWVSYDDIAETAKSDAATAKGIADGAASSASTANNLLTDIASDSKLTPTEKKATKKEWDIIVGEKPKIDISADTYGITTEKTAYNTAYNALNTYLSSLLANLNTTSNIVGTTFRSNFRGYYNARQDLLNKIADGAKSLVDEIEVGGRNLIVQQTITTGRYLTASNGLTADARWFYTDYIPVSGYTKMVTSGYTNLGNAPSVVYYDSSKNFVRGINNGGQNRAKDITINSGEAFIRFSGMIRDLQTIKLEKGNKATDWTPAPEDIEAAYTAVAQAKAEAERIKAESYADGKVTAEETARITDAEDKYRKALVLARASSGKLMNSDPNFSKNLEEFNVYNNASNGNVSIRHEDLASSTGPSGVTRRLRIITTGAASPSWGGIIPNPAFQSRANAEYVIRFTALLPTGRNFHHAQNAMGTGSTVEWLTSTQGTGTWEEYVYYYKCGSTGTFSNFGHLYVRDGSAPTVDSPLVWFLDKYEALDVSNVTGNPSQESVDEKASVEDLTNASNDLNTSIGDLSNTVDGKLEKSIYEEFLEHNANIQQQLSDSLVSAEESISNALARTATVEQNLGEGAADWIFTHTKIRMSDDGITLGEEGSGSYLQISNNQISFFNGSTNPVAFINGGMLHINHAIFVESIQISEFMLSSEIPGHLTLRYVGN